MFLHIFDFNQFCVYSSRGDVVSQSMSDYRDVRNAPQPRFGSANRNQGQVGGDDILGGSIYQSLKNRRENLEEATSQWPNADAVMDSAFALGDPGGVKTILRVL